ncbi:MAG: DUF5615 family PIN-like protein [Acidimicrobiia bacterium]
MRFVVDQCVPVEVARTILRTGSDCWTARQAGLDDAADADLIAYCRSKAACLVTTNRDCAWLARRLSSASVVWLATREAEARGAMERALRWAGVSGSGR